MKDPDACMKELYDLGQDHISPEHKHVKHILHAKYDLVDIWQYVDKHTNLNASENNQLFTLLKEFEFLFKGMLSH